MWHSRTYRAFSVSWTTSLDPLVVAGTTAFVRWDSRAGVLVRLGADERAGGNPSAGCDPVHLRPTPLWIFDFEGGDLAGPLTHGPSGYPKRCLWRFRRVPTFVRPRRGGSALT